ncbi:serine hydrolase domain-containing protein [Lysobacter humi (ex Lee et al. 2017)]
MRACLTALMLLVAGHAHAAPHAPVASVRVAFDASGITSAHAEGLADIAAGRAVDLDSPVRVASISKLVTALAVMRLVEAGRLDLDRDVSDWLGWRMRHPAHPDVPVTLRLLLSHRAGLTDAAGYYAVPLDGALRDLVADPRAWDSGHAPGTHFRYANLGSPVVASVMEAATGERFDRLVDAEVFQPLGIDACFNWTTCDDRAVARAVVLYDADRRPLRDDLQGRRPPCPVLPAAGGGCDLALWRAGRNGALFSPQGGLRISARGLVQIGRLLLAEGQVDGRRLLRPASIRMLATPHWQYAPGNGQTAEDEAPASAQGFYCGFGLAIQILGTARPGCRDDPFGDGRRRIGHAGLAYGLVSGLWIDPATGQGVAYFATGVPDVPGDRSAFMRIEERLATGGD